MAKQNKSNFQNYGRPTTQATIARFERTHGIALPAEYRSWLLKQNGGKPTPGNFRYALAGATYIPAHISIMLPLDPKSPDDLEQEFLQLRRTARIPADLICIAHDGLGNLICLNFKGSKKGRLFYWDHELEAEEGDNPTYANCFPICKTFSEFLEMLAEKEPDRSKEVIAERRTIVSGRFPPTVDDLCREVEKRYPEVRKWMIDRCVKLFDAKAGDFMFHGDPASRAFLDAAFWLKQMVVGVFSISDANERCPWVEEWTKLNSNHFGLGGYAPGFVDDWQNERIESGLLKRTGDKFRLTEAACRKLVKEMKADSQ